MKGFVELQFLFILYEYEKRKNQYRLILPLFILKKRFEKTFYLQNKVVE